MIQIDERFTISVGKRLKALRKQHDLTVSQVVDKLSKNYVGMSEKSIQRYENGKCLPKIENLIGLADLFHTTLDYIMLGKETPVFTLKELDELFEDFAEEKEQFAPTPQRYNTWLKNQGIDPEAFWKEKVLELEKKREETV